MMAFLETPRFPDDIAYGAVGGSSFSTSIVVFGSGYEQRKENWYEARGSWDVSHGIKRTEQMHEVVAFYRACKGRAHGFRFKDHSDYQTTVDDGILVLVDGTASQFQIVKTYSAGNFVDYRPITKPVDNTVVVYVDAVMASSVVDTTTGIVTLNAISSIDITAITQNVNAAVQAVGHGFSVGDRVDFSNVSGMNEINGLSGEVVSVTDVDNFVIDIDTSLFSAYTSDGEVNLYVSNGSQMAVVCEFDVPVRFDNDKLPVGYIHQQFLQCNSIPIVEIRV